MIALVLVALAALAAEPAAAQSAAAPDPSEADLREIERAASQVLRMHGELVRHGDGRVSCMNDVLTQINASMRMAVERLDRGRRSRLSGDVVEARRSEALVRSARDTVRALRTRATYCMEPWRAEAAEREGTIVITTIAPDVPGDEAVEERPPPRSHAEAFSR